STSYTDTEACSNPRCSYMVRAVKLETSASGTYYNASQGAFLQPVSTSPDSIAAGGPSTPTPTGRSAAPAGSVTNTVRALTPTGGTAVTNNTIWFDDSLPAGA